MNKYTFLNREIEFGTYFLGEFVERVDLSFDKALALLQTNPLKYIPIFIHTAINTTAELNEETPISLKEVINEVDKLGYNSKEIQEMFEVFTKSIETKVETPTTKKKKPAKG